MEKGRKKPHLATVQEVLKVLARCGLLLPCADCVQPFHILVFVYSRPNFTDQKLMELAGSSASAHTID
jgi:hypothetical protein